MTAELTLKLTTAKEIQEALEFIGINWRPSVTPSGESGLLYTWGVHASKGDSLDDFAVLYVGKDVTNGKRLADEQKWSGKEYYHAHALAIQRTKMIPISARPEFTPEATKSTVKQKVADLVVKRWQLDEDPQSEVDICMAAIDYIFETGLSAIETLAIRLSIHVGEVGAPINSSGKNAWALKSETGVPLDTLAYWLALEVKPQ